MKLKKKEVKEMEKIILISSIKLNQTYLSKSFWRAVCLFDLFLCIVPIFKKRIWKTYFDINYYFKKCTFISKKDVGFI